MNKKHKKIIFSLCILLLVSVLIIQYGIIFINNHSILGESYTQPEENKLFINTFFDSSKETQQCLGKNISLSLLNSIHNQSTGISISNNVEFITIKGFITDKETKKPINNAKVFCYFQTSTFSGLNISNNYTDTTGYYTLKVPDHFNLPLFARKNLYYMNYSILSDSSDDIKWMNISLDKGRVPETSKLCGYITEKNTGKPISNATIMNLWTNGHEEIDLNFTHTNSLGYYEYNVAYGSVMIYHTGAEGYLAKYNYSSSNFFWVDWRETVWKNISLQKIPDSDSLICGYIKNQDTDKAINDASILLNWKNEIGMDYEYASRTDYNGFYKFPIPSGQGSLHITHPEYFYKEYSDISINEKTTKWINISLKHINTSDLLTFEYNWDKKEGLEHLENPWIPKDEPFEKKFIVRCPEHSVFTRLDVRIEWDDDHTFGLLQIKGKDILLLELNSNGKSFEEKSVLNGTSTFSFNENPIPEDGFIKASSKTEAALMLNTEYDGRNEVEFHLMAYIETGEPFWRLINFLKDKGNSIDISVGYEYYSYNLTQIND
jgi:hypothetical protein